MRYRFDGKQPVVGKTSYISEIAQVIGDVVIGDDCYIGHGAILRGDYGRIVIGDGASVEEGAIVHAPPGDVNRIGKHVTVGHGAILHGEEVGDHAVIGMGSVIGIWSKIGEWSILAEGSIVKRRQIIPPEVVVAGNPATIVRKLAEKDKEFSSRRQQIYIELVKKYLEAGMTAIGNR
ncbi:MAG: gamma carbonic anhydrase family protein [Desulfobacterales bacterium]|jgi:carbonic anhydrase/acetyltransferase-like protein (isoleucine patch superfamily)|nr:gamma carbonic anhydrase family protein [Desulfobacterales bacterium]